MTARLFVTDMDGTLLNSQRKISEANREAIAKAIEKGVIFTLATGRMYAAALPFAKDLGLELPIITYNGAVIKTVSGQEIYTAWLEEDLVREILAEGKRLGYYIQLYSDDKLYFRENNELARVYQSHCGVNGQPVGEDLEKYCQKVPKMLLIGNNPEEATKGMLAMREKFGDRLVAVKSAPTYVELIRPDVSKASAIRKLAEIYNIRDEEILAIGDSGNDISMIKAAAYGVAMGNASEEVKKVAKYQVADCDHDGVAEALERFC